MHKASILSYSSLLRRGTDSLAAHWEADRCMTSFSPLQKTAVLRSCRDAESTMLPEKITFFALFLSFRRGIISLWQSHLWAVASGIAGFGFQRQCREFCQSSSTTRRWEGLTGNQDFSHSRVLLRNVKSRISNSSETKNHSIIIIALTYPRVRQRRSEPLPCHVMAGAPRMQSKISQARARTKRWLLLKREASWGTEGSNTSRRQRAC